MHFVVSVVLPLSSSLLHTHLNLKMCNTINFIGFELTIGLSHLHRGKFFIGRLHWILIMHVGSSLFLLVMKHFAVSCSLCFYDFLYLVCLCFLLILNIVSSNCLLISCLFVDQISIVYVTLAFILSFWSVGMKLLLWHLSGEYFGSFSLKFLWCRQCKLRVLWTGSVRSITYQIKNFDVRDTNY